MTALLPILHEIDLRLGLDEALALRRAGRERRSQRSRKGWCTRRDREAHRMAETRSGSVHGPNGDAHSAAIAQIPLLSFAFKGLGRDRERAR